MANSVFVKAFKLFFMSGIIDGDKLLLFAFKIRPVWTFPTLVADKREHEDDLKTELCHLNAQ